MYDNAVKLAKEHSLEICRTASKLIHEAKIGQYGSMDTEELAKRLVSTLEMQLRYINSGDLAEWREFTVKIIEDRSRQGLDYSNVVQAGQLLVQSLGDFFDREVPRHPDLDDLTPDKLLSILHRRLNGLNMVATTTGTATGIKQRQGLKEQS